MKTTFNNPTSLFRSALAIAGLAVSLNGHASAQLPATNGSATCNLLSGYAFTYPQAWTVKQDQQTGFLKIDPDGATQNEAYIVGRTSAQGVASAEDPRCAAVAEQELRQLIPGLRRVGTAQRFQTGVGPGVLIEMEGPNNAGVYIYTTVLMAVHGDDALFLIAIGPKATIHSHLRSILVLFSSIHVDRSATSGAQTGLTQQWMQRLGGRKLTILSGYSSGMSGGFNGQSEWRLLAGGRYTFHSSSSVSIYVEGATGGSASEKNANGTWRIVEQQGFPVLELRPNGSPAQFFRMEYRDHKTYMNGRRVFVTDL